VYFRRSSAVLLRNAASCAELSAYRCRILAATLVQLEWENSSRINRRVVLCRLKRLPGFLCRGLSGTAATRPVTVGAPEFGSAMVGLREFRGATSSIFLMPAKRGVVTDDRN
jgi:hypothetical protein